MVVGDADNTANTGDEDLEQFVFDLQFFVVVLDDADDSRGDLDGKGLVIISESVAAAQLEDEYRNVNLPVLCMDDETFGELDMTDNGGGDNGADNDDTIEIVDTDHPLAAGLPEDEVEIYNNQEDIVFGECQGDCQVIADTGNNDEGTIFVYEAGDELSEVDNEDPRIAKYRRVGFFASEQGLQELNADGDLLLEAAIKYTHSGSVQ